MAPCPTPPSGPPPCPTPPSGPRALGTVIYLSRHGESVNNLYGKIGGNSSLTDRGRQYARALAAFLGPAAPEVWVTGYRRTQETAAHLPGTCQVVVGLGELGAGAHDGLTYEEIADRFPAEFAARDQDKLRYRYPEGESYLDVVKRVEPVVEELRRRDNLLVISHQATLRCLLSLLLGSPLEELPYVKIPLHTVLKVTVGPGGAAAVEQHRLPVDCVDTHRARPEDCAVGRGPAAACRTVPDHL